LNSELAGGLAIAGDASRKDNDMTCKSILMTGVSALILSGAAFTTALADDYDTTRVRYDSQAEQTRDLNNASLENAQAQNEGDDAQPDDSDGSAVAPTDDADAQDDEDDDAPNSSNDEISKN